MKQIKSTTLIFILTLYFSTVLNLSFWRYIMDHLEITSGRMFAFALSLSLFIFVPLFLLFSLITIKKIAKPLLVFLLLLSAGTNFMTFKYGIFIDKYMIQNVMETTTREATDLITVPFLFWIFLTGVIPAFLLIRTKIQYQSFKSELKSRGKFVLIAVLLFALSGFTFFKEYVSFGRNNRHAKGLINVVNYTAGTIGYIKKVHLSKKKFQELDINPIHVDYVKEKEIPTVLVFILGETARANNFSLNGYEKKTNPLLEKQDIAYFKNVHSCGTATAISVPCMFSNMNQSDFDTTKAKFTENLIDLAQKAGYDIIWRENDDGCKGVCSRAKNVETMLDKNNPKYCHDNYCWDESLLDGLEDILAQVKKNTFIVLHTQGSHGPTYYKRYPDAFKQFTPTCDTADIQNCPLEEIINTYDNTILYTDYIVSSTIDMVKKHPEFEAGVIYVSDHGESLGENNIYLHGMPYKIAPKEQTNVPMLIWMNENMKKWDYIDYKCLKNLSDTGTYTHDNIFHSILGLLEIKTNVYDKNYDLFHACRLKPLPSE